MRTFLIQPRGQTGGAFGGTTKRLQKRCFMRSSPPAAAEAGTENNPVYRSGEPLRHPKSSARASEKLTVREPE